MTLKDLCLRVRALFFRARVEQELEDEVEFHLAMSRQRYLAAGHSQEEASRLARLDFGRVGAIKEDCRGARGTRYRRNGAARHSLCTAQFLSESRSSSSRCRVRLHSVWA